MHSYVRSLLSIRRKCCRVIQLQVLLPIPTKSLLHWALLHHNVYIFFARNEDKSATPGMVVISIYVGFFILPGLQMFLFHTQLIRRNLTTNEYSNIHRYTYLQDEAGRFSNPFNKGIMHNFYTRMCPSEEAYTLPSKQSSPREMSIMRGDGEIDNDDDRQRLLNTSV